MALASLFRGAPALDHARHSDPARACVSSFDAHHQSNTLAHVVWRVARDVDFACVVDRGRDFPLRIVRRRGAFVTSRHALESNANSVLGFFADDAQLAKLSWKDNRRRCTCRSPRNNRRRDTARPARIRSGSRRRSNSLGSSIPSRTRSCSRRRSNPCRMSSRSDNPSSSRRRSSRRCTARSARST